MTKLLKGLGWTLAVAVARIGFIIGWTVAIGLGGALLTTLGFAGVDWITGIAKWEDAYAAHLGQIAAALMTGLTIPAGAAVALWRFQTKRSRTFNVYSLDTPARIGVIVLCFALGVLLIIVPLSLAGGQALRAIDTVQWAGAASDVAVGWAAKLRMFPLLVTAMIFLGLAERDWRT